MNSKILLITGRRAEDLVKKNATQARIETVVRVLPISIASFINLSLFLRELKNEDLGEFSMILVPGLVEFDLKKAEEEIGTPVFKGPKHAADISLVLNNLDELELSKETPASELLKDDLSAAAEKLLNRMKEKSIEGINETANFKIGEGKRSVVAGPEFPPRIVAEIIDAPNLSDEELIDIGKRYVKEGAEILDIGMTTKEDMSQEIPRMISLLRENFDVPLSIDTTNEKEIKTAAENGIDLVISIDGSTIENFKRFETPSVIIPRNPKEDYYPVDPEEKINYLEKLLKKAENLGFEHPILDPILEPIGKGFVDSFLAYNELRNRNPDTSVFMGIGNVIELFDADSIGMTALLLGSATEMNVDFVLSVEGSNKTRGNISEISTARDMMTLAESRDSVPKDLGLDLLRFKEKRKLSDPYEREIEKDAKVIEATGKGEFTRDKKGFFRIFTQGSNIIAVFHSFHDDNIIIKGKTAGAVLKEILKRELISELSHAAYLGRELEKAEIAIRTDRGYIQEEKIF
ncbi:hypothetical protein AKJ39_04615 [candidate division MSBL1 archaeon SCGC-AAA259J03]|uniref:Pterin-binding domain-containing protein n=3 Tax=candidate division MSBL1 TaxID=215777 RepID=A0A133URX3_9EURY|nr:hypothetical protein AKJ61_03215 [candidate division MSBL1 archaeon SCGC-AAA259B11]KXA96442.1 hypothetical protein AKJ39_04615 [candidate division MSBL1 archaeon SCGC-AAA259J03]KXA96992.1 hypothetical protein AKJ38_02185 [candidate division MSBL1 archaeon SCGC-AAA259I14]